MVALLLAGLLGCLLLYGRLRLPAVGPPQAKLLAGTQPTGQLQNSHWPSLSLIVPARNEAANLPRLLHSVALAGYPGPLEVLVIDDHSQDQTAELALEAGAIVLSPPNLPAGWSGKSWACHWGGQHSCGELLLFMDADCELLPQSLGPWVQHMLQHELSLSCPLPWHRCESPWEKALGAFHLLYLLATTLKPHPTVKRLYANGQCLLFVRSHYLQGGHAQVAGALAEDLALARLCLQQGQRYGLYLQRVYQVRMYASLSEFVAGWRRNLRLGLQQSSAGAVAEVFCVLMAGLGAGQLSLWGGLLIACCSLVVARLQRQFGDFANWGALLAPLAVICFMAISLLGLADSLRKQPVHWKDRAY